MTTKAYGVLGVSKQPAECRVTSSCKLGGSVLVCGIFFPSNTNGHRKIKRLSEDYTNQISPTTIELSKDELNTGNRKQIWTRKWILRRGTRGARVGLLRELANENVTE